MKKTVLRMSDGSVEETADGKPVVTKTVDAVRKEFGDAVAYLLEKNGSVGIIDGPCDRIGRAIYVK